MLIGIIFYELEMDYFKTLTQTVKSQGVNPKSMQNKFSIGWISSILLWSTATLQSTVLGHVFVKCTCKSKYQTEKYFCGQK